MLSYYHLGEPMRFEAMGDAVSELRITLNSPPSIVLDGREDWYRAAAGTYDRLSIVDLLPPGRCWLCIVLPPDGNAPAWFEFARAEVNYWLLYRAMQESEDREKVQAMHRAMCAERRIQRAACELELVRGAL